MFGYWEDISVAPGLSDFRGEGGGRTGDSCVTLENRKREKTGEERPRLAMQEDVVEDVTHAAMFHASHAVAGARAAHVLEF